MGGVNFSPRQVAPTCPACGAECQVTARFCANCGTPLAIPKADEPGTLAVVDDSERRQITVLFCDLVGSMQLSTLLDPEDFRVAIRAYQRVAAEVVARYEGFIAQHLGDGLLVYFGYPRAHEDDAARAIHAGLEILVALRALNLEKRRGPLVALAARIGIHTGVVVVGEIGSGTSRERLALGDVPNLAARLQTVAAPDTVVVSERTAHLAGGEFDYADLGVQALKGVASPLGVKRVDGVSVAASRFDAATQGRLTPMVARDQEIALLLARWRLAQDGEGQVVLLGGEPGIGKSRILSGLRDRLESHGARALRFQCSPYHTHSAFYPTIDNFERALKFARDETPASKLDKLEALIVTHYRCPREDVRFIAALLSIPTESRYSASTLSPQRFKDETLRVLADLTEAAARQQPTVMLFEDLHWADPTSLEVLDLLLDRVRTIPLLIVLTHRPEFQSRWGSHGHVTALNLSKLTKSQSGAMVDKLVQGKALPGDLLERILTKTDGVPLFVEELTKSVLESGTIKDVGERYEYTGTVHTITLPASLRDSLMARLDRHLPVKAIAQIGAVIGRAFSYELIQAVAPGTPAELDLTLRQLTVSGLAFRRGTPPDAIYTFKHALIQDAAYDSLLKPRRQELHGRVAGVIEERFARIKDTAPELLANHYTAAGLSAPAIAYWLKAAKHAASRSAYAEALAQLEAGTALLEDLPPGQERSRRALQLQLQRATALFVTKGKTAMETGEAYGAARALCDQLVDNLQEIFPALFGISVFHLLRAEFRQSLETAQEVQRRAQQSGEPASLVLAHRMMGYNLLQRGGLLDAVDHLEHVVRLYDSERDRESALVYGSDHKSSCLVLLAQAECLLGYPTRALATAREAVRHAEALVHPHSIVTAVTWLALVHLLRREPDLALGQAQRGVTLSELHEFSMWYELSKAFRGAALIGVGATAEGMAMMSDYSNWSESSGLRNYRAYNLAALAAGAADAKQGEDAWGHINEALEELEATGERWYEAEIHRLKAELLLTRGGGAAAARAEGCFLQSLQVARAQSAKGLELRTSMSLARLWQHQGKLNQARDLLTPIYDWFTEGFDTQDLQDAKAQLAALSD